MGRSLLCTKENFCMKGQICTTTLLHEGTYQQGLIFFQFNFHLIFFTITIKLNNNFRSIFFLITSFFSLLFFWLIIVYAYFICFLSLLPLTSLYPRSVIIFLVFLQFFQYFCLLSFISYFFLLSLLLLTLTLGR